MPNCFLRPPLLLVAALAWSSVAFSQPPPPPERPSRPQFGARVAIGLRYWPAPHDYRWLADLLPKEKRDSAEAKQRIAALSEEMWQAHERRLAPLLDRAAECAVGRGPHESAEAALAFKSLIDDRNRAVAAFDAMERDAIVLLCDTLELDEPTRAEVDRERLVRLRSHLDMLPCDLLPAGVDLEPLLQAQNATLPTPTDPCLSAALRGYADEMYRLRAQHARMLLQEGAEDALEFTVGGADGTTLVESRRRRSAPRIRTERSMIESNREWARRIGECLAPEARSAFLDRWRARSFPLVHPIPYDLRDVVAEIGRSERVDAATKEQLLPALGGLQARIDEASRRMEDACLESWTGWARTHSKHPTRDAERLTESLGALDRLRRDGASEAIALVADHAAVRELASFEELAARVARAPSPTQP